MAETDGKVGPTRRPTGFPNRRAVLRKVKAFWSFYNDFGKEFEINAAEMLYLFAAVLNNYYNPEQDFTVALFPSHVLPKGYFEFLWHGRYGNIFGGRHRANWFDLGQRWSMKPAVLS